MRIVGVVLAIVFSILSATPANAAPEYRDTVVTKEMNIHCSGTYTKRWCRFNNARDIRLTQYNVWVGKDISGPWYWEVIRETNPKYIPAPYRLSQHIPLQTITPGIKMECWLEGRTRICDVYIASHIRQISMLTLVRDKFWIQSIYWPYA
jgi:hypothetical protein